MDKLYRAVFQASTPATEGKHPILLVSVGQNYHEGGKLLAAVDLINRSNFNKCTVMLADSLQRHNYTHILSQEEAYKFSIKLGSEWIERNLIRLNQLTIPYEIIRWDQHLQQESFCKQYQQKLLESYNTTLEFKNAFNKTVYDYIERQKNKSLLLSNKNHFFQSGLNYVFEECPILMPLWASQGYDFIIYPKKMTTAMRITFENFVAPYLPEKVIWLPLRFRARKSL